MESSTFNADHYERVYKQKTIIELIILIPVPCSLDRFSPPAFEMISAADRSKFDITTRSGLANFLDLIIQMFGNVALTRLVDMLEQMHPDVNLFIPRDFAEFIVRELEDIDLYVVGQTIRITKHTA